MAGERLSRILGQLRAGTHTSAGVCSVVAEVVRVRGAGVMLIEGDVPAGSLCTSDDLSRVIEELQFTLGEGPCIDAYETDQVVLEPDLADPATPRWFAFSPQAVAAGARAVFGFPIRLGTVRFGALNLHHDRPGSLDDDQHADALVLADVVASWILDLQAGAPPGALATEIETGGDFHFAVHNAAGMVSVQLGVTVAEAMVRLRGHAFGTQRPLAEVAQDVVARRLRFS